MPVPQGTDAVIAIAYDEDLGEHGDITSRSVIDPDQIATAHVVARERGCVSGIDVARACFAYIDGSTRFTQHHKDGNIVDPGTVLLSVSGATISLLTAERVALNLLGRMSGIATATRSFVDAIEGTETRITDTRKTTPGLRALEKYAVASGGGVNHRFGLHDAVLIKDNHIAAAGSISDAVAAARAAVGSDIMLEVEVDTLAQLAEVLTTDADRVLLDNMSVAELSTAVAEVDGSIVTEASGGITLDTVRSIAETGVDIISVGWLTHSAPALDVALDIEDHRS
jgi:nicotinate-nucleotide pyrophosphorylase (carboxylating)